MKGFLRLAGLVALGAAWVGACDLDYPTSQWDDAPVDHLALSGGFDLVGVHETATCASCHDPHDYGLKYDPAGEEDCVACHAADYEEKHGAQGYPTECTICHTPTDWGDGSFDHEVSSGGFELWGPHLLLPCTACHDAESWEPRFDPDSDRDCGACHG